MTDWLFREDLEEGDHARTFRDAALTRVAAAVAFVVSIAVLEALAVFDIPLGLVLGAVTAQCTALVLSFPYTLRSRRIALAGVIGDLLAQTIVAWLLGPARIMVVLIVYVFGLIKTGLRLTRAGYFLVANSATLFYGLMVSLETSGAIPTFEINNIHLSPLQSHATIAVVFLAMNIAAMYVSTFDESRDERARALAEARRKLLEHSRTLEEAVRTRTSELEHTNELLAEKNRELELYAVAVSHDLRSPMVAAGEALRVARGASTETARERCLDLASDNLERADRMLVGLRDLMRTVGSQEDPEEVAVEPLVREVLRDLADVHGGGPVPVEVVGELGEVSARGAKLQHVFRNLIQNALEHGGEDRPPRVQVGRELASPVPTFFVRDDGAGIPYEYQARIFEPYRRGPHRQGAGMGLGLALVAQIVAEHGGRAWVESEPGAGATFRFTLPTRTEEGER